MKRSRFTETQIVSILKEADAGGGVKELCRKHGISDAAFYKLEGEVRRYERLRVETAERNRRGTGEAQADVCGSDVGESGAEGSDRKKTIGTQQKRDAIAYLAATHGVSIQRSCRCVGLARAAWYRTPAARMERDRAVIEVLQTLVARYPQWGFWKYFKLLRRRKYNWNHKRVYRIYCALRLNHKRRAKRRVPQRRRHPLVVPAQPNQVWSADFMSDALYGGPRSRPST